jgi:hypothetical protein
MYICICINVCVFVLYLCDLFISCVKGTHSLECPSLERLQKGAETATGVPYLSYILFVLYIHTHTIYLIHTHTHTHMHTNVCVFVSCRRGY